MRMRFAPLLALVLILSSCDLFANAPKPSASAEPTAAPTQARPRLELSTYQYGLQVKGRIRVGIADRSAPFSVRSGAAYTGFDADIARAIARAIWGPNDDPDAHIQWVSVDASTRISALTSNQADIVVGGLLLNDDNKKVIDLTDGYYKNGQRLLIKKTNKDLEELADIASGEQTVCAIKGSPWEANVRKLTNDRAKILPLETLEFCQQALKTGAADAITQDEATLLGIIYRDPDVKLVAKPITDDLVAIGIKKNVTADRQGFREFLNATLLAIVADRTWARIYAQDLSPLSGDKKQLPSD